MPPRFAHCVLLGELLPSVPGHAAVPRAEPQTSGVTRATSDPTFFLFHCPVKAWNEFQKMLSDTGSPAFPREGPKTTGEAGPLPERGHGPAAGQADAAVPPQGGPPGSAVPIPGEEAVIIHARLAAQALCSRILEGSALVEAVLAVHGHGAQPAAGAALAGEARLYWEEGSRRAAATRQAGLFQLQRAQQSVVVHLPWKQKPKGSIIYRRRLKAGGQDALGISGQGAAPSPRGKLFPGLGYSLPPAFPHVQNQSCSLGNPLKKPTNQNSPLISQK